MLRDMVIRNRSYRRFYEDISIGMVELKGFVDLARLSASAANHQPLKYFLSADRKTNALILRTLHGPPISRTGRGHPKVKGLVRISSSWAIRILPKTSGAITGSPPRPFFSARPKWDMAGA